MSGESRVPFGDELSKAIREKVAEANKRQRQLTEASVHARQVLAALRPTLEEIAAFMHRETGLDIIASNTPPTHIPDLLSDSPNSRTAVDLRELTVFADPPVTMMGGFQSFVALDGTLKILVFWSTGDCQHRVGEHCWSELVEGQFGTADQAATVRKAAELLYSCRHKAAEFLLDTLRAL